MNLMTVSQLTSQRAALGLWGEFLGPSTAHRLASTPWVHFGTFQVLTLNFAVHIAPWAATVQAAVTAIRHLAPDNSKYSLLVPPGADWPLRGNMANTPFPSDPDPGFLILSSRSTSHGGRRRSSGSHQSRRKHCQHPLRCAHVPRRGRYRIVPGMRHKRHRLRHGAPGHLAAEARPHGHGQRDRRRQHCVLRKVCLRRAYLPEPERRCLSGLYRMGCRGFQQYLRAVAHAYGQHCCRLRRHGAHDDVFLPCLGGLVKMHVVESVLHRLGRVIDFEHFALHISYTNPVCMYITRGQEILSRILPNKDKRVLSKVGSQREQYKHNSTYTSNTQGLRDNYNSPFYGYEHCIVKFIRRRPVKWVMLSLTISHLELLILSARHPNAV